MLYVISRRADRYFFGVSRNPKKRVSEIESEINQGLLANEREPLSLVTTLKIKKARRSLSFLKDFYCVEEIGNSGWFRIPDFHLPSLESDYKGKGSYILVVRHVRHPLLKIRSGCDGGLRPSEELVYSRALRNNRICSALVSDFSTRFGNLKVRNNWMSVPELDWENEILTWWEVIPTSRKKELWGDPTRNDVLNIPSPIRGWGRD